MNDLFLALVSRPALLERAGRLLALLSLFIGLFAVVGHTQKTILNTARSFHAGQQEPVTLAVLYPSWPTAWIPESFSAAVFWLLVFAAGVCLMGIGRKLRLLA
ncbi:hypothetical protein [uncultured Hydrogenophaga sp.]|uniref:hypothetical protein n=1 Tax=uncultured Hydrogenophaga sp. TaxID=199683 RepID=UPI00265E7B1E|nr:hypothetical protein [uncultured Hydrogenophaga sp.]